MLQFFQIFAILFPCTVNNYVVKMYYLIIRISFAATLLKKEIERGKEKRRDRGRGKEREKEREREGKERESARERRESNVISHIVISHIDSTNLS